MHYPKKNGPTQNYILKSDDSLDQLYQSLQMESNYVEMHKAITTENSALTLHSHNFYELIFCASSSGIQYLIGTERYRLQRGDIVMVPPGVSHRPLLEETLFEPYQRYVLWMTKDFVRFFSSLEGDSMPKWYNTRCLIHTAGTSWDFLENLFVQGVRESEQNSFGSKSVVFSLALQILLNLARAMNHGENTAFEIEKPELLDNIVNYIENNLANKVTLAETAKRFWVSESTISKIFRQKLNLSFYQFVTQRRLVAAKALILDDVIMDEISNRVGFSDYSTFYRAFKKEFGISPREFKKNKRYTSL